MNNARIRRIGSASTVLRVATVAVLMVWTTACGPGTTHVQHSPRTAEELPQAASGAIVVHNLTPDALELWVAGRLLTTVASDSIFRSGRLEVGVYRVVAKNTDRGVRFERLLRVKADREVRWQVLPRWSALLVSNGTRGPVAVSIDDAETGTVPAKSDRRFTSVPVGLRRVIVRDTEGETLRDLVLAFREGSPTRLDLAPSAPPPPEPATLVVENLSPVHLVVLRDGRPIGRVRSRTIRRFEGLMPGQSDLEARGPDNQLLSATHVYLSPGSLTEWDIVPETSRVRIVNRTQQRYTLVVDGQLLGTVSPGGRRLFAGIRPGRRTVEARPARGGVERWRELVCPPGGVAEWIINPPPRAEIEVRNGTQTPIDIFVDGGHVGRVRPGFTMRFGALLAGAHRLEARTPDGPPHVREVVLRAGETVGWVVGPRPAAMLVQNGWNTPAIIVIDGHHLGPVPPRGKRLFEGLVPGRHVVSAERRSGGAGQRDVLVLQEGQETRWMVRQDAPATLRVVNRNAVPVELSVDGRSLGSIPARGDRSVRDLRAGTVNVVARAPSGALAQAQIELRAGEHAVWEARLPDHSALRVVNRTERPVVIELDERQLGRVGPGTSERFEGLPSGGHDLRAISDGKTVRAHRAILATGESVTWIVTPLPRARLRVSNAGPQRIIVALDGQRLGPVHAGNTVVFRDLEPRVTTGVASTRDGREVGRQRIALRAGEESRWKLLFAPEQGDLVVRNKGRRSIQIRVGGKTLGIVPAGARQVFELPRGLHDIKAYDTAPRPALVASTSARIGPRPFRWDVAPASAVLRLRNRSSEPLDVVVPGSLKFRLRKGGVWKGSVPTGRIKVRGVGLESGARYDADGEAKVGGELSLKFVVREAVLIVENHDEEALEISIDGSTKRRVKPGAVVRLRNVPLGARKVSVRGLRSGRIEKRKVVVTLKGAKLRFGPK